MHPNRCGHAQVKRGIDAVVALVLLVAATPVIALCGLVVRRRDPGPALFRQPRGGVDGRSFVICKLRTMRVDAEHTAVAPLAAGSDSRRTWEESRRSSTDPRVISGIGSALRKSSLDELPQLWNVLRGDMSLVGPRPLELAVLDVLPPELVRRRASVRPGLTGLWQVSGRSDLNLDQLLDLDLAYVDSWSLWLDLRILLKTPAAVFAGRGAY